MYFDENWQSMAEKEPALGHVDMFQTSPNESELSYLQNTLFSLSHILFHFASCFLPCGRCSCLICAGIVMHKKSYKHLWLSTKILLFKKYSTF